MEKAILLLVGEKVKTIRYYIADSHFFHTGMNTRMDKRGFLSVEEMNEYMINHGLAESAEMMKLLFLVIYLLVKQKKQMIY